MLEFSEPVARDGAGESRHAAGALLAGLVNCLQHIFDGFELGFSVQGRFD
jgi:hypothetical protein